MKYLWIVCLSTLFLASPGLAFYQGAQPGRCGSLQTLSPDGTHHDVVTLRSCWDPEPGFAEQDPWGPSGPSNLLPTVYKNSPDMFGTEMPNTLPSTEQNPYNLHDDPVVERIDPRSPTTDLDAIFRQLEELAEGNRTDTGLIQFAVDILEGNPVNRIWSGVPLLHYQGPNKIKNVVPIKDGKGRVVGGNVVVNQYWFDSHIESDTALVNPAAVLHVPWTITYRIHTLDRGHDDFASMVMYFANPKGTMGMQIPHVAMDQTFFPMEEGLLTTFKVKMSRGKYYNLSYHWGWRIHPPRVQVIENSLKEFWGISLLDWEKGVFGDNPTASEEAKLAAISKIGDIAPAKRMWNGLRAMLQLTDTDKNLDTNLSNPIQRMFYGVKGESSNPLLDEIKEVRSAFQDWSDRSRLPAGIELDPNSDITLLYANNTIYGEIDDIQGDHVKELSAWRKRGYVANITLYNGDYFPHGYVNVDFGGRRGWENTFHSTTAVGGAGVWFTFGRFHWWINAGAPNVGAIIVPPAAQVTSKADILGRHTVSIEMNFEPSKRLRMYQFDPLHHDVAVWSVH
ncbi:hypothetical protein ACFL17_07965 [Pseudomonadota bacterium]